MSKTIDFPLVPLGTCRKAVNNAEEDCPPEDQMKKTFLVGLVMCALSFSLKSVHAQTPVLSAGQIAASCSSAQNIKLPNGGIDKSKTADLLKVGQCIGFLKGWIEGADGTTYQEGNGAYVRVTIKRDHIKDVSYLADDLLAYLARNPYAKDKAADDVLRKVLHEKSMLNLSMVTLTPKQ